MDAGYPRDEIGACRSIGMDIERVRVASGTWGRISDGPSVACAATMVWRGCSLGHRVPASRLAGRRWSRPHVLARGEPVGDDLGAFHAAELPFVFDALDRPLETMPAPGTASAFLQVRDEMMAAGRVRAHPILGCSATTPRSHLQGVSATTPPSSRRNRWTCPPSRPRLASAREGAAGRRRMRDRAHPIGSRRMRIRSSVTTTIAPVSRSGVRLSRCVRMTAACSSATRW